MGKRPGLIRLLLVLGVLGLDLHPAGAAARMTVGEERSVRVEDGVATRPDIAFDGTNHSRSGRTRRATSSGPASTRPAR